MLANRFTAVVDACTLVNRYSRNLLLSLSVAELFRIRWSEAILLETQKASIALGSAKPELTPEVVERDITRLVSTLRENFHDAMVDVQETPLLDLSCVDDKDKHVAAAAVCCNASVIVTENISDFPDDCLTPLDIEVKTGDQFIADTIDLDYSLSLPAIKNMRERFNKPELTPDGFITELERYELFDTASLLSAVKNQI